MKHNRSKGFTLLEVLVVLGIIIVIIGVGSVSYASAQRKARDSKRMTDLRTIQNSLEQYYSVCGFNYPLPTDGEFSSIACASPAVTIMDPVPADPRSADGYPCTGCTATAYTICATLEAETGTFCVRNQQ